MYFSATVLPGEGWVVRADRSVPFLLVPPGACPSAYAAWGSLHWDLEDIVLWSLAIPTG